MTGVQTCALPIFFPIHPRTRKNIETLGLKDRVDAMTNLRLIEPAGYLDFLKLMDRAKLVLTDSGGIQEETTILQVPCLTLRENTERPVTVDRGSNRLLGTDPEAIAAAFRDVMDGNWRTSEVPPMWDGKAAGRICDVLEERFGG